MYGFTWFKRCSHYLVFYTKIFVPLDVDECVDSSPCLNGGTCQNSEGNFSCDCNEYWKGPLCELGIDDALLYKHAFVLFRYFICLQGLEWKYISLPYLNLFEIRRCFLSSVTKILSFGYYLKIKVYPKYL